MFYSRSMIRPLCNAAIAWRTTRNNLPAFRLQGLPMLLVLVLAPAASARADLDINEAVRLALADDPVIAASKAPTTCQPIIFI